MYPNYCLQVYEHPSPFIVLLSSQMISVYFAFGGLSGVRPSGHISIHLLALLGSGKYDIIHLQLLPLVKSF